MFNCTAVLGFVVYIPVCTKYFQSCRLDVAEIFLIIPQLVELSYTGIGIF